MRASLGSIEIAVGGVLLLAVGLYVYTERKAIATAVNPLSQNNVANKAAEAVTAAVTGNPNATPASLAYSWLHPNGAKKTTYHYDAKTGKIVKTVSGGSWWSNL